MIEKLAIYCEKYDDAVAFIQRVQRDGGTLTWDDVLLRTSSFSDSSYEITRCRHAVFVGRWWRARALYSALTSIQEVHPELTDWVRAMWTLLDDINVWGDLDGHCAVVTVARVELLKRLAHTALLDRYLP